MRAKSLLWNQKRADTGPFLFGRMAASYSSNSKIRLLKPLLVSSSPKRSFQI